MSTIIKSAPVTSTCGLAARLPPNTITVNKVIELDERALEDVNVGIRLNGYDKEVVRELSSDTCTVIVTDRCIRPDSRIMLWEVMSAVLNLGGCRTKQASQLCW